MKRWLVFGAIVGAVGIGGVGLAGTPFGGDDTGFVPPDTTTAKCEDGVSKNVGTLVGALIKCNLKDSDDQAKHAGAGTFDGAACQDVAKTKFDAKVGALAGCPACLDKNGIRDLTITLVNLNGGVVFCDTTSGTAEDPPNTGFVPPNKTVQKCEDGAAKNAAKLTGAVGKCHIKAADSALKDKTFDEEACEVAALAKYTAASGKLTGCPACLGPAGQTALGALVENLLDSNNNQAYCAWPVVACSGGTCTQDGSYCDGPGCPNPVCHSPDALSSLLMCTCPVLSASCGLGSCRGDSYCSTGSLPDCIGVCLAPTEPLAQVLCGGVFQSGCGVGTCVNGSYCDNCRCYVPDGPVSLLLCNCPQCAPRPGGMVGWWPLDEVNGVSTAADTSGNALDGTYADIAHHEAAGVALPPPPMVGGALNCDDPPASTWTVARVAEDPTTSTSLDFGTGDFSVDAWLYWDPDNSGGGEMLLQKSGVFYLAALGSGAPGLHLHLVAYPANEFFGNAPIPTHQWVHVAATMHQDSQAQTATAKYYINGVFQPPAVTRQQTFALTSSSPLEFCPLYPYGVQGFLDEVELFNRELEPWEIQKIYAAGSNGKCR